MCSSFLESNIPIDSFWSKGFCLKVQVSYCIKQGHLGDVWQEVRHYYYRHRERKECWNVTNSTPKKCWSRDDTVVILILTGLFLTRPSSKVGSWLVVDYQIIVCSFVLSFVIEFEQIEAFDSIWYKRRLRLSLASCWILYKVELVPISDWFWL